MQKGKHFEALFLSLAYRYIVNFTLVDAVAVFIELGVALLTYCYTLGKYFCDQNFINRFLTSSLPNDENNLWCGL